MKIVTVWARHAHTNVISACEFRPLIFKCSKRALDCGGRCDHYHFNEVLASYFGRSKAQNKPLILVRVSATRTRIKNVAWTKTTHNTLLPIKGSKWPFDFAYFASKINGPVWTIDFQVITMITWLQDFSLERRSLFDMAKNRAEIVNL